MTEPKFPICVISEEDGEESVFEDVTDVVCHLEWFDSDDPEYKAKVFDAEGKRVRLKVVALDIKVFELM